MYAELRISGLLNEWIRRRIVPVAELIQLLASTMADHDLSLETVSNRVGAAHSGCNSRLFRPLPQRSLCLHCPMHMMIFRLPVSALAKPK